MTERRAVETPVVLAALLLVAAAALRLLVNDVVAFSGADETVYLRYAKEMVAGGGFPALVRMFVDDPGMWVYPHPLRWSWIGASALACSVAGECTHQVLATLSTLAGIAAVPLAWWVGRELFGATAAWVATALVATSPLQLALGRRVLSDEFYCALFLASLATLLAGQRAPSARARNLWLVAWVITATLTFAAKELFLLCYPLVLFFAWLRRRAVGWREVLAWALPPALFAGVYCLLVGELTSFGRVARIVTSMMRAPYAEQFQSGPAHRLLIDSLALAPLVMLLAVGAGVAIALRPSAFPPAHRHLAILAFGIFALYAVLPSLNLRYVIVADPLLRILAGAYLVFALRHHRRRLAPIALALVAVNAAVELTLFHDVFVSAAVYDPVTDNLLRALRMLPR